MRKGDEKYIHITSLAYIVSVYVTAYFFIDIANGCNEIISACFFIALCTASITFLFVGEEEDIFSKYWGTAFIANLILFAILAFLAKLYQEGILREQLDPFAPLLARLFWTIIISTIILITTAVVMGEEHENRENKSN